MSEIDKQPNLQSKTSTHPLFAFLRDYSIIVGAHLCSVTFTAPLNRAMMLLQIQHIFRERSQYSGIINCFTEVVKNEGISFLWRGNVTYYFREVTGVALNFSLHESFKKMLPQYSPVTRIHGCSIVIW